MGKVRGVGTTISIDGTVVGSLSSIGGVDISTETVDVTTLDTEGGYREFLAGFKDAGEVGLDGFLDDTDEGQAGVYTALESAEVVPCVITFPNGAKWEFNGIVTGFGTSVDLDGAVSFTSAVKVSGKPTFTLSAE